MKTLVQEIKNNQIRIQDVTTDHIIGAHLKDKKYQLTYKQRYKQRNSTDYFTMSNGIIEIAFGYSKEELLKKILKLPESEILIFDNLTEFCNWFLEK